MNNQTAKIHIVLKEERKTGSQKSKNCNGTANFWSRIAQICFTSIAVKGLQFFWMSEGDGFGHDLANIDLKQTSDATHAAPCSKSATVFI